MTTRQTRRYNKKLMPREVVKELYLSDLTYVEDMLERWRHGWHLDEGEAQAVWVHLDNTVRTVSRRHFGRRQKTGNEEWFDMGDDPRTHDQHTERVLQLADFLKAPRTMKWSVAWVITAYKRRFAAFEALREMKEFGIQLPPDKTEQCTEVQHWVRFSNMERALVQSGKDPSIQNIRRLWEDQEKRYGRPTTLQRWVNFCSKYKHYTLLRGMCRPVQLQPWHSVTYDGAVVPSGNGRFQSGSGDSGETDWPEHDDNTRRAAG